MRNQNGTKNTRTWESNKYLYISKFKFYFLNFDSIETTKNSFANIWIFPWLTSRKIMYPQFIWNILHFAKIYTYILYYYVILDVYIYIVSLCVCIMSYLYICREKREKFDYLKFI